MQAIISPAPGRRSDAIYRLRCRSGWLFATMVTVLVVYAGLDIERILEVLVVSPRAHMERREV